MTRDKRMDKAMMARGYRFVVTLNGMPSAYFRGASDAANYLRLNYRNAPAAMWRLD